MSEESGLVMCEAHRIGKITEDHENGRLMFHCIFGTWDRAAIVFAVTPGICTDYKGSMGGVPHRVLIYETAEKLPLAFHATATITTATCSTNTLLDILLVVVAS